MDAKQMEANTAEYFFVTGPARYSRTLTLAKKVLLFFSIIITIILS